MAKDMQSHAIFDGARKVQVFGLGVNDTISPAKMAADGKQWCISYQVRQRLKTAGPIPHCHAAIPSNRKTPIIRRFEVSTETESEFKCISGKAAFAPHGCSLGPTPLSRLDDPCKIANPIKPHPKA
jgi:hypothetical protein